MERTSCSGQSQTARAGRQRGQVFLACDIMAHLRSEHTARAAASIPAVVSGNAADGVKRAAPAGKARCRICPHMGNIGQGPLHGHTGYSGDPVTAGLPRAQRGGAPLGCAVFGDVRPARWPHCPAAWSGSSEEATARNLLAPDYRLAMPIH